MKQKPVVLAIASSPTGTRAHIANLDRLIVAEYTYSMVIPHIIRNDAPIDDLYALILKVLRESGIGFDRVFGIVVTMSELLRNLETHPLSRGLESRWKRRKHKPKFVKVVDDARLALSRVFPQDEAAIVASCQRKAYVIARDNTGRYVSSGGWGIPPADPGSGDAIVYKVLNYIASVFDEREAPGHFFEVLSKELSIASPVDFQHALKDGIIPSPLIQLTVKSADDRDPTARTILDEAAFEFVAMVRHCATRMPIDRYIPMLLLGEIFEQSDTYKSIVERRIRATLPHVRITNTPFSPIEHATDYAADLARHGTEL